MLPQSKELQRLLAYHQRLGQRHEPYSSRHPSERNNSAYTLISDFCPPELWENKVLLFKPPGLWYFVRATPANHYRSIYQPTTLWLKSALRYTWLLPRGEDKTLQSLSSSLTPISMFNSLCTYLFSLLSNRWGCCNMIWRLMGSH